MDDFTIRDGLTENVKQTLEKFDNIMSESRLKNLSKIYIEKHIEKHIDSIFEDYYKNNRGDIGKETHYLIKNFILSHPNEQTNPVFIDIIELFITFDVLDIFLSRPDEEEITETIFDNFERLGRISNWKMIDIMEENNILLTKYLYEHRNKKLDARTIDYLERDSKNINEFQPEIVEFLKENFENWKNNIYPVSIKPAK